MKAFIYKNSGVLAACWFCLIFILCATPGDYIPSNNWLELLSFDKFVHASIFFILTILLFLYADRKNILSKRRRITYCSLTIIYGVLLELMQAGFFRNRSADWKDMVANAFGCLMALFFYQKIRRKFFASSA